MTLRFPARVGLSDGLKNCQLLIQKTFLNSFRLFMVITRSLGGPAPAPPGFVEAYLWCPTALSHLVVRGSLHVPGETESRSVGTQRLKGYSGRWCANGTVVSV